MATVNSGKKIEGLNGISNATIKFMDTIHENLRGLRTATDVIQLPLFDNIYNGIAKTVNNFNTYAEEQSDGIQKIARDYAERQGFGATAKVAFEDCATVANNIKGAIQSVAEKDLSDGLHENVTDETVAAFVRALRGVLGAKEEYIAYVSTAVEENIEADTQDLYMSLGGSVEHITNGFARLYNSYGAELKKFQIDLETIESAVKSTASNITASGQATATQIGSHGDVLM